MPDRIEHIIEEAARRELSGEERRELEEWLALHPGERDVRDLWHYLEAGRIIRRYRAIDERKAWAKVDQRTTRRAAWASWVGRWRWWAVAAVMLPLAIGIFWGIFWGVSHVSVDVEKSMTVRVIKQGKPKAYLEMADGEVLFLEKKQVKDIVSSTGTLVGKDSINTLVVDPEKQKKGEPTKIRVPQGGEYRVVLSDGTRVWINSDSELRFPSVFDGKERVVELVGEAYFEVSRDTLHPFIVRSGETSVRVLGTSFNVCRYADDDFEQVTLAQGAVEVSYRAREYRLTPGDQFEARKDGANPVVRKVDVNLYTSWKDGMFRFQDMPLDELMQKLQRWYNVDYFFVNATCRDYRFTGAIRRDADFNEFVKSIEKTTNVRFTINGNNVMISEK